MMVSRRGRVTAHSFRRNKCQSCDADLVDGECMFCGKQPNAPTTEETETPHDLLKQLGFNP